MKKNFLLFLVSLTILNCFGQKSLFKQIEGVQSLATATVDVGTKNVQKFKLYDWDQANVKAYLATAPNDQLKTQEGISFDLPLDNGSFETFIVKESPISTPEYMENHPNQRFYEGYSTKNKAVITRFGYTENGFHAIILGLNETVYLAPTPGNQVMAYKMSDLRAPNGSIPTSYCSADKKEGKIPVDVQKITLSPDQISASSGDMLRTYRAAFLCNAEFTNAAGSVSAASGLIGTYVNQMKAIYKRDLSIDFMLVANNDNLIFTTPGTPIGNASTSTMSDRGTPVIDSVIGAANYNIGHIMGKTTATGDGIASQGGICLTTSGASGKGDAVSRVGDSFTDAFAFHLILHEAGHQFGCSHSFNSGSAGACTTRSAGTAVEPGAGVTLMSYAATCSPEDIGSVILQFHTANFDQVFTTISAAGCPAPFSTTATTNTAPTVTVGANFTIPKSTPFTLTGSATDAQNDPLTYVWEEVDAGATAGAPTSITAPFFKSFAPVAAGNVRTFPVMSGILDGTNAAVGEALPSVATTMNFRLVTRDNNAAGGGVAYNNTNTVITVDGTSGPFLIMNDLTGTYSGNTTQTINWSVNNTNFTGSTSGGVNFRSVTGLGAANVKISLSTDGGATFPTVLSASTPNNGAASVTLPNINTTTARIKVEAINNIFFDVSNSNFAISSPLPLPVNWLDFTATLDKDNNANLVWHTASEQNNKGYTVEISSDGTNFEAIGEIKGAGTTAAISKYTFVKALETPDRYYFRIKQEDYNGKIEYSKIISLSLKGSFDAKFYPTPAKDELTLDIYTSIIYNFNVDIVNTIGQTVLQLAKSSLDEGRHTIKFNTSTLNEGIYFYNIHSDDKVQNGKIVIQR